MNYVKSNGAKITTGKVQKGIGLYNTRVIISSNPENLMEALNKTPFSATVEAEYGDRTVEGSLLTLAHHGQNSDNICPCLHPSINAPVKIIGISHFDLDTLGGIMSLTGKRIKSFIFWQIAAQIDLYGPHKFEDEMIDAWNAWSEKNRIFAPRDGSVLDVTDKIIEAIDIVNKILERDKSLIEAGREWRKKLDQLNIESFVNVKKNVVLRKSDSFVNAFYNYPKSPRIFDIIVGYNSERKSITISKESDNIDFDCNAYVKSQWGEAAGGHIGIAGSPRGVEMTFEEAERVFNDIAGIMELF